MKKVLFGTTALAVAMSAGAAMADGHAAAPQLSFTGFYQIGFVGQSVENGNAANTREDAQFYDDAELQFGIKYDVESLGVEVGIKTELLLENNAAVTVDESYMFIQGGFGKVELGENDGAHDTLAVRAMFDDQGTVGMGSDNSAAGSFSTYAGITSDHAKVTYYTPKLGGIVQAGASFTPAQDEVNGAVTKTGTEVENVIDLGIAADADLGGIALAASAGWSEGEQKSDTAATLTGEYSFGLTASMAGFTVGGSYIKSTGENNVAEPDAWQIGAQYSMGALTVGVNYGERDADTGNNSDTEAFGIGASYSLAESVTLSGGHQMVTTDANNSDASMTGISLNVAF